MVNVPAMHRSVLSVHDVVHAITDTIEKEAAAGSGAVTAVECDVRRVELDRGSEISSLE